MRQYAAVFFNKHRKPIKVIMLTDTSKDKATAMIEEMIDCNNQSIPDDWDDYEVILK